MKYLFAILIGIFQIQTMIYAQEILYQKPGKNISLIVASNNTHTYRLNVSSYAISISKFDKEMAFEDALAIYPENEFHFKEGKKRQNLNSFVGLKEMVISENFLHLIFESVSRKKANLYLFDLKIDLQTFEAKNEMDLIYKVEAKRKVDLYQASNFHLSYISYADSLIKGIYQKPNKFKDDFQFGFVKMKISDKIELLKESEITLMPGVKRDFFDVKDFYIDEDDNMMCVGDKIAQDKYTEKLSMFFYKKRGEANFSKLNSNLDKREIEDYRMFIEEGTPFIFGLCSKTEASSSNKSKNDSEYAQLESFALIFKNDNYQYPEAKYFENSKKEFDGKPYYRMLRNITSKEDDFYLVFQYIHGDKPEENVPSSYFNNYSTTYVRDFELHKLDNKLNDLWEALIPYKASYSFPEYESFTRCNLIFKDNDEVVLLYNDAYENSKKELDSDLKELDLSFKKSEKTEETKVDRNSKIEDDKDDENRTAYTLSFVSVNTANGEFRKLDYNQRKLYSLVFNGTIKGYRNNQILYVPYYYDGMFGICSIDKNKL